MSPAPNTKFKNNKVFLNLVFGGILHYFFINELIYIKKKLKNIF
jgi:hypothetical protein